MQPLSATPRSTGGKQASGQGAAGPASERWPYPTPLLTALHRRISDSPSAMNPWPPLGLRAPSPNWLGGAVLGPVGDRVRPAVAGSCSPGLHMADSIRRPSAGGGGPREGREERA